MAASSSVKTKHRGLEPDRDREDRDRDRGDRDREDRDRDQEDRDDRDQEDRDHRDRDRDQEDREDREDRDREDQDQDQDREDEDQEDRDRDHQDREDRDREDRDQDPEPQRVRDRLQVLKELTDFTEDCRRKLNDMLGELGWSLDYKWNRDAMEQCPYDANHRVPVTSMEKHKASCSRRKMGYSAEEEAEMFDPSVCYENSSVTSFTMDKSTQHQVILQARSAAPLMRMEGVFWQGQYSGQPVDVPQNHKRAVCDLTVADRLALYNHAVGVLSQRREAASCSNDDLYVDLVSKLQKDEDQNEPKTHLELMAEMRDYKRRRQSYRAKNVHITKKSYTEVIREVINVHSGELNRRWREEEEEEQSTRPELSSHRRRLEEKRSPSSESRHSKGRRRRSSRERSPDRESKKKRKKRERDSCSPDEHHHHHHDRKKKKKKKREEREKEK